MSGVLQLALKHLDELSQAKGVPVERSLRGFHKTLANGVPAERMERSGTNRADGTPDHTPAPPETGTVATDRADKRASVSSVGDEGEHVLRLTPGAVGSARRPYPNIPIEGSDAIDRLLSQPCPEAESPERWARACWGVEQFAQQWAGKAKSLGWTFDELFALREPFANVSLQGAVWFIGDSTITAVTADAITLSTERGAIQRIYRKPRA